MVENISRVGTLRYFNRLRHARISASETTHLGLIVRGYLEPHPVFAFQMFREASSWQADIYRVTPAGERIDIRDDWPGYEWSALDWVAENTPLDRETVRLEADVTYWENERGPFFVTFRSVERVPEPSG